MPHYDYACTACGRRFEVMHGVHASGPDRCDACGGRLQRLMSVPTIHFKGSGWAKKDARVGGAKGATRAKGEPVKAGEGTAGETKASKEQFAEGSARGSPGEASASGSPNGAPKD